MHGARVPVRVLKSPQVMAKLAAGEAVTMLATASLASCSRIFLLRRDGVGGR